jgi:hypothetical protein
VLARAGEAEGVETVEEGSPRDTEERRGATLVPAAPLEHFEHGLAAEIDLPALRIGAREDSTR